MLDRLAAGIDPLADFSSTTEPEGLRLAAGEPVRSPFQRQPVARAGGPVAVTAVTSPAAGKRTATRTLPARPKPTVAKRSAAPVRMPAASVTSWAPMLATPGALDMITNPDGWRFEGKWDGIRITAELAQNQLVLRTRTGRDVTTGYPELAELPGLVPGRQVVLDGEVVAMDRTGRTDFGRLQQRMGLIRPADIERIRRTIPVAYLIFDILALDGESLHDEPLDYRRSILEAMHLAGTFCLVPPQLTGDPADILAQTKKDGWEGIVAKRGDSRYQPGARNKAWLKLKNILEKEVAVIGWQPGRGRRDGTVGSLLLAVPAPDGGWTYAGKAGSGLSERELAELTQLLGPLRQDAPAAAVPRADARTAIWVTPQLVGEVVYSEMTHNGTLRHPRWRGLHRDKTVADLTVD